VLPLVDDFETPSSHYLVFEHCGMDLAQYVASRGGALPEPEASAILVSVFSALAGLHAAGVAHRDLKPANILIRDARHPASSLCLGDFGSAHTLVATSPRGAFPPPAPISRSTFTGTPYFLSPELVLGLPYGPGADVWAAGCTAHFLLTGRTPFSDSASLLELYNRIAGGALDLPAALSPAARAFLRATLDPHPETRITAREALEQPFL
ncbi:kinase-like domain-containing protein, partial [Hyaloraphidium curvatum]